jgi:hypothetical protein
LVYLTVSLIISNFLFVCFMSYFQGLNIIVQKQFYSFIALLKRNRAQLCISAAAIVVFTFFLYEAEPYNISLWHDQYKILKLSGYGFIYVGTICLCIYFTPPDIIYPTRLNRRSVLLLTGMLIILVVVAGSANWVYASYIYDKYPLNASSFFKSIKHTASFSLLSALYYVGHLLWRDKDHRLKFEVHQEKDIVTFCKFSVRVMDIVLIRSDENYIFLYCLAGDNTIRKNCLRYRISYAEKQLSAYPQFIRVHRSFVVNMMFVDRDKLTANCTNFKITGIDIEIFVGERFKENLKKWLLDHSDSYFRKAN